MFGTHPQSRRIRILRDEVSRKIAAGEVIDRPFSIVRELLDNSIDAGASSIDVYLEAGGVSRVRVVDDGSGMDSEDIELCWQPHATSKIETENDLLTVTSLGFRGEALSSMAIAGRLELTSSPSAEAGAHRVIIRGGKLLSMEAHQGKKGTAAEVSELFFDYPARRKFLKSPSSESGQCRSIFTDRAAAHPSIGFRLFTEGTLKIFLPPADGINRITQIHGPGMGSGILTSGKAAGSGFTVTVIAGDPSLRKRDRRLLQCFVNRRRVPEFALIQAVEYGFAGFFPGGWFPVAFVFVEIDPSLVDFNIHPAKKEVRFRNLPDVHAAVVRAVREMLGAGSYAVPNQPFTGDISTKQAQDAMSRESGISSSHRGYGGQSSPLFMAAPEGIGARFLGQIFGVFLVFELADRILFLDQHAAHEKVIFERLMGCSPDLQEMLVPLCFDVSEDEENWISDRLDALASLGITIHRSGRQSFEIVSLSNEFAAIPVGDLVSMVKGSGAAGEEWRRDLIARAACRLAVKEGDAVDSVTAAELFRSARSLDNPRCPHGRPIWHEVSRADLYRLVDRPL
jgi:DNA mismatch repair protein MutL